MWYVLTVTGYVLGSAKSGGRERKDDQKLSTEEIEHALKTAFDSLDNDD